MNNSTSITAYKPLTEVIDFQWNKYYSELSVNQITQILDNSERIEFSFSWDVVKCANIMKHRPAKQEDVLKAWITKDLTDNQKKSLDFWIEEYMKRTWYKNQISEQLLKRYVWNIKIWKAPFAYWENF